MKVCKFGGTSMATSASIKQVESIILADAERKFIVVSAPGKRFKGDTKVTDLLYQAYDEKQKNGAVGKAMDEIRMRFVELSKELEVKIDIEKYVDEVAKGINAGEGVDYAASRGEYLSAVLLSARLGFKFVDAQDIIKFRTDGSFDAESTDDAVSELKGITSGIVIPGFYGSMPDKKIKTFSRGGSDVTGAIIAKGVKASIYENWTDVNGFMVADPTIIKNPKQMDYLSYEELRELSYMGAAVLHPDSIFPVKDDKIPINIRNTFEPENKGTMIVADTSNLDRPTVTGIAGRKGNTTIAMKKAMMNSEHGFGRKVLSVLERHGISFEHMPTGIDTMSIVITDKGLGEFQQEVVDDIRAKVDPDYIEVIHSLALIAVVGHGMENSRGTAARIFNALYGCDVNVRMIDQGSSEMNIIIGVEEKDYEKALKAIYCAFFD